MLIKSWLTSLAGALAIIIALFHCFSEGKLDFVCVNNILLGAGLIAAKDFNVTGGTKQ